MARYVIKAILNLSSGGSCPPSPPKYAAIPALAGGMRRISGTPSASTRPVALAMLAAALLGLSSIGNSVSATGESASLSSSGVNFEITPTSANPNGTVAIGTDNLTVSSTCSSGYKLYISTTSNDETDTSLVNTDNAEYSIPAVSGTIASPTLLNSSASKNHWGFAMASGETGIADTGFSESTNTTVTNASLFSSIPTLDNMTTIRQKTSSADNETVNVYYGVNAGIDLTPGSYSSTVMYTMVMPSPCDYTLMFEDGISDDDPVESEVTKMPESTNIGRNTEVNLGNYISEFVREGYSITGWKNLTDNLTYGKDDTVNINTTNADIIKLAPIWTINNYTISINTVTGISSVSAKIGSGSGTEVNNVSEAVQYGTTVTIAYTLSEGFHFEEWEIKNVDADSEGNPLLTEDDLAQVPSSDLYTFTMPASNVELSPKAEGNKYTVHFNSNGGTGTMNDVEMTYGSPSTLPENTFAYGDYEFYGWSKTQQEPSIDPERGYTDGQTGVFNLTTSNPSGTGFATLYAVWKIPLVYDDIMQNWKGCTGLTISTTENYEDKATYADLLDTRNNVVYRVRKYADQNCWMTQNLRLTPGNSDPGNSVVDSGTLSTEVATSQNTGEIIFANDGFNKSIAGYDGLRAYYGGNMDYGAYYTWSASLVVCPAGWTLPTNAHYSDFLSKENIENSSSGSIKIHGMPYDYPYAGYYIDGRYQYGDDNDGAVYFDGSSGFYWSSVQFSNSASYRLYVYTTSVNMGTGGKLGGFSVRCIQQNYSTTMQGFTSAQCAALSNHSSTTLTDIRNSVNYTVTKMADGKCWMTQNLRITPGTTAPTANVTSGTLTTTTATSQAAGTVNFVSAFSTDSYTTSEARYDTSNSSSSTNTGYYSWTAANLVCPAGWTLPTQTEWANFLSRESMVDSSAGSSKIQGAPYNFVHTGHYNGSSLHDTLYGVYWSSTVYPSNINYAYNLGFSSLRVFATNYNIKYLGFAARCVHS